MESAEAACWKRSGASRKARRRLSALQLSSGKGSTILLIAVYDAGPAKGPGGLPGSRPPITAAASSSCTQGRFLATARTRNHHYRQMFDPGSGRDIRSRRAWSFQTPRHPRRDKVARHRGRYNHRLRSAPTHTAGKVGTHLLQFLIWGLQSKPFLEGKVKATGITVNFQDGILIRPRRALPPEQELRFYNEMQVSIRRTAPDRSPVHAWTTGPHEAYVDP